MLQSFPPAVPLVIVAPAGSEFGQLAALRNDPMTRVAYASDPAGLHDVVFEGVENIVLEGLDASADPHGLLRAVARGAPRARLFLLVANAAHFGALGALYRGGPAAAGHPLVESELEPLLRSGGWQPLEIRRIFDDAIAQGPLPVRVDVAPLRFTVDDGEMLARCRVQAFVAIADAL